MLCIWFDLLFFKINYVCSHSISSQKESVYFIILLVTQFWSVNFTIPSWGVLGVPRGIRILIPLVPNRPINRSGTFPAVRSNQPALSPTFATIMHQSSKKRFNCSELYFHLITQTSPETRRRLAGDSPDTRRRCRRRLAGDVAGDPQVTSPDT
jgi:hypothetical protein